jgi:hypothetical protein
MWNSLLNFSNNYIDQKSKILQATTKEHEEKAKLAAKLGEEKVKLAKLGEELKGKIKVAS